MLRVASLLSCFLLLIIVLAPFVWADTTPLDVYDWDVSKTTPIGQIHTIATAQTGKQHYNYYSASGHPSNVNLGTYNSSFWVHENTNTGEFTFGFIFSIDNSPDSSNQATLDFRIVDSDADVFVSQSDDPGEAVETLPGAFQGNFSYGNNTDGIAVSGVTGTDWTIIIDSVNFGDIKNWYAASGEKPDFTDDLVLILGHQYRIVLEGHLPSGAPVTPKPDLTLSSEDIAFIPPWPVKPGTAVTIDATIQNQGELPATCDVSFYKDSKDPTNLIDTVSGVSVPESNSAPVQVIIDTTGFSQDSHNIYVVISNANPQVAIIIPRQSLCYFPTSWMMFPGAPLVLRLHTFLLTYQREIIPSKSRRKTRQAMKIQVPRSATSALIPRHLSFPMLPLQLAVILTTNM